MSTHNIGFMEKQEIAKADKVQYFSYFSTKTYVVGTH